MNNRILTIAALAATLVAGVFATTQLAFADGDIGDSSETKTKQEIKQSNGEAMHQLMLTVETTTLQVKYAHLHSDVQVCGTADRRPGVLDEWM